MKKFSFKFIISCILTILIIILLYNNIFAYKECSSNYIYSTPYLGGYDMSIISDFQDNFNNVYFSDEKIVYLTFDDGPTKIATPKILDILKKYDIKATFFVIGYRVKEFPQIVKRAFDEGHLIANHGYSHKNSKLYSSKDNFTSEILKTDEVISDAIGIKNYHSHIFRFPNGSKSSSYSSIKQKCKNYLKDIGYCYIDWNALNNDSIKKYSSSQLVNNLKNSCKNKNSLVILMHDTSDVSKSYEALEDSIKYLISENYTFKTLDSLLYTEESN